MRGMNKETTGCLFVTSLGVWDRGLMTRPTPADRPWSWSYTFLLASNTVMCPTSQVK